MSSIADFFKLKERGSTVKKEIIAGVTTFLTMAYIIVVNPSILSETGMPFDGILFATVIVSAIASILMGIYANLPYALAPGMGLNAFFTYTLVLDKGVSWETALGAVVISGIIFIILSITKIRTLIVKAIPIPLRHGVAGGIGLFLTFIGFQNAGFVIDDPATLVSFGGFNVNTVLFIVGLVITGILVLKRVKGALILGIIIMSVVTLITSLIGTSAGFLDTVLINTPDKIVDLPSVDVVFKFDIVKALTVGMIGPIFALIFTDMFDSLSTFVGLADTAKLVDKDKEPLNVNKALLIDAVGTTVSGLVGSSPATTYIESASGIEEGGRTGLTAIVTGLLFLPFMFLAPLLSFIPQVATAPILVVVGVFMMATVAKLDWKKYEDSIPAFMALVLIPLTYSITQGILWGFIIYTLIKLIIGKGKDVTITLYIIDIIAIVGLVLGYLD